MSLWGGQITNKTLHTSAQSNSKPDKKFMAMLRPYCTLMNNSGSSNLNPWFVTGFCDAESSFQISIVKRSANSLGWKVAGRFDIYLDRKDLPLLLLIQQFFGGIGSIVIDEKRNKASFNVNKLSDFIDYIIPHFERYPLQSTKFTNYIVWRTIIALMVNKAHLLQNGLIEIVSLKAGLNNGLTEVLKENFPIIEPIEVPIDDSHFNLPLDPNWISGFSDGDSSFYVSENAKGNFQAFYKIGLHEKEFALLSRIKAFFNNLGTIYKYVNGHSIDFRVTNKLYLVSTIIPHFHNYPLVGNKLSHFNVWKEVVNILNTGEHLTPQGAARIRGLKSRLNK